MHTTQSLHAAVEQAVLGLGDPGSLSAWPVERAMIGGLLTAMALALATLAARSLLRRDHARHGPTGRRFVRALGITTAQRRLLEHVAREAGIPHAASLLVSRGCFDKAVKRCGAGADLARQMAGIRRAVFGQGDSNPIAANK